MAHAARKYQKVGGAQDFKDPVKFSNAEVLFSGLGTSNPAQAGQAYLVSGGEITGSAGMDGTFKVLVVDQ